MSVCLSIWSSHNAKDYSNQEKGIKLQDTDYCKEILHEENLPNVSERGASEVSKREEERGDEFCF